MQAALNVPRISVPLPSVGGDNRTPRRWFPSGSAPRSSELPQGLGGLGPRDSFLLKQNKTKQAQG